MGNNSFFTVIIRDPPESCYSALVQLHILPIPTLINTERKLELTHLRTFFCSHWLVKRWRNVVQVCTYALFKFSEYKLFWLVNPYLS